MASTIRSLPNSDPDGKVIAARECAIEDAIVRLNIQPAEIRAFRTVAFFLDYFVWDGARVDLRIKKAPKRPVLLLASPSQPPENSEAQDQYDTDQARCKGDE